MLMKSLRQILLLAVLLGIFACSPKPEPLRFGRDGCSYCKMKMMDNRFGAEIVTRKGKAYKYDSIECMAADLIRKRIAPGKIHSVFVIDFGDPGKLIDKNTAVFIVARKLTSPMGLNITAYGDKKIAENMAELYSGEEYSWEEILALTGKKWF